MANRAYLYAVDKRPTSYADRPHTIHGLSEWAWSVPFTYRVLLSGSPTLVSSLISDGFSGEPEGKKTSLFAISGDYRKGVERFGRFARALKRSIKNSAPDLVEALQQSLEFLHENRSEYFHLETVELDSIDSSEADVLRRHAQGHLEMASAAGRAVDSLSRFDFYAARQLLTAVRSPESRILARFKPFAGLALDNGFDDRKAPVAMGVTNWDAMLYYQLQNRSEFEAAQKKSPSAGTPES